MTKKPSIAVIIPNYNHAAYLEQRLDSVLNQTLTPERIVVLDDCSTDNSEEIVLRYQKAFSSLLYIPSKPNSGDPFSQWNKGLLTAREDYVWIAESDDWAEPLFLETLIARAIAEPNAGVIYCQSDIINERGEFVSELAPHYADLENPSRWSSGFTNSGKSECANYFIHRNTIPNASACLFKRSILEKIGLASIGYRLCGDWITYVRILEISDIAYHPETLNHYRTHSNTVRSGSEKALIEVMETYRVLNYISERFDINEEDLETSRIRTFERLHYLIGQSQPGTVERIWASLYNEAERFDPYFENRIANPHSNLFQIAVLYFDEKAHFTEKQARSIRIPPNLRKTLTFTDCKGELRFDPTARPGAIELFSITLRDDDSNQVLWRSDAETKFEGIEIAGTASILEKNNQLKLYSHGNDPQILLKGWSNSPNFDPNRPIAVEIDLATGARRQ